MSDEPLYDADDMVLEPVDFSKMTHFYIEGDVGLRDIETGQVVVEPLVFYRELSDGTIWEYRLETTEAPSRGPLPETYDSHES